MATTYNADTTPLPFCPEDGNDEDQKAAIKAEILKQLAPIKHRADDLVNVLRIRRSFLEGSPPYKLDHVIDKWLDHAYDTVKYGPPCWNSLIEAVADVNGGANKALAKRLAGIYKVGVHSIEPSRLQPSVSKPEEETIEREVSPERDTPPSNNIPSNIPHPQYVPTHPSPQGVRITKPLAESSGDESSINPCGVPPPQHYQPSSSSSNSTVVIPPSVMDMVHPGDSSGSSSNSTFNIQSGVTCSEMSSDVPSNITGSSTGTSSYGAPSTGTSAPSTGTSAPSTGTSAPSTSTSAPSTGTSANISYGGPLTDTSSNSSYEASTGTSAPSTGASSNGLLPTGTKQSLSPQHEYHAVVRQDSQQEASDYQSSAMVTSSAIDYHEAQDTESEVADDGSGKLSFPSLTKKVSSALSIRGGHQLPPALQSYEMAKGGIHGYALIINNIRIDGREERLGAEHDGKNLSDALTHGLGYKLVDGKVHVNCTAYAIKELFERSMNIDHTHYDSFMCCILSHGDSEFVYGTDDNKVWLSDLQKAVIKCKTLVGKPKVFFVQACRGGQLPDARRVQVDDEGVKVGQILLPEACDVFFGYATSPNTKACRFTNAGSWYIIELCKAFKEYPNEDLMTIVQIAQYNVSTGKDYEYTRQERGIMKTYRQSPQLVSTLIKKLYFH